MRSRTVGLLDDDGEHGPDLSGIADLTHLRPEAGIAVKATPDQITDEEAGQKSKEGAAGKQYDDPRLKLSEILKAMNDRFGLNVTEQDQLFIEQVEAEVSQNPRAQAVALNNDYTQFMTVFPELVQNAFLSRHSANDSLVNAFLDKPEFRDAIVSYIGESFSKTIRQAGEST